MTARISSLTLFLCILAVTAAAAPAMAVTAAAAPAARADAHVCLRLNNTLVNPVTGESREMVDDERIVEQSPDGRYSVVRYFDSGQSTAVTLYDHETGNETHIAERSARVFWSADSQTYGFITNTGQPYLTVGSVADGIVRTAPVDAAPGRVNTFRFYGFSGDGQYAAIAENRAGGARLIFYELPYLRPIPVPLDGDWIREFEWSPAGHTAGFVEGFNAQTRTVNVHVVMADESWHIAYGINSNGEWTDFIWPPAAAVTAVTHRENHMPHTEILSGGIIVAQFRGAPALGGWDDDGPSMLVWDRTDDSLTHDLVRFDAATGETAVLARDIIDTHALSADGRLLVAPVNRDAAGDMLSLTLFRLDTGEQFQLAEFPATSVYRGIRVYWPPQGDAVAVVQRTVSVEGALAEVEYRVQPETPAVEVNDTYANILAPVWSSDSRSYLQWRSRGGQIQVVWFDARTQQESVLADGLTRVDLMQRDTRTPNLSYRWLDDVGRSGVDLIGLDGARLSRWETIGAPLPVDEGGYPFPILLSQDNRLAVITSDNNGEAVTQLFPADGAPVTLPATGPIWMPISSWSPDDSYFMYVSIAQNQASTVYVVNRHGEQVAMYEMSGNLLMTGRVSWEACAM